MHFRVVVAAATVVALATIGSAGPVRAAVPSCPTVVSHRTSMLAAPENTLAGIAVAAASGASAVEMDVQWSNSAFPVLMHDATVDRTTNGTGTVANMSLSALTSLTVDIGPGYPTEHVPYGWEFMNAASSAGIDVLLDLHQQPTQLMAEKLHHYIVLFGWQDRTTVMANVATVTAMRGWYPDLHYALIEAYSNPGPGVIRSGAYMQDLGVEAYVTTYDRVVPQTADYWHSYGLDAYGWTSDTSTVDVEANWSAMAAAGADAIITNQPVAALAWEAANCS